MKRLFSQHIGLTFMLLAAAGSAAGQTTTLTVSSPVTFGQTATMTATVTGGATPTGSVSFYDSSTYLGTAKLSATSAGAAAATYKTKLLTPLKHSIVAVYRGDANHNPGTSIPEALSVATLGANGFQPATNSPVPTGKPFGLAVGDFNGDAAPTWRSRIRPPRTSPSYWEIQVIPGNSCRLLQPAHRVVAPPVFCPPRGCLPG